MTWAAGRVVILIKNIENTVMRSFSLARMSSKTQLQSDGSFHISKKHLHKQSGKFVRHTLPDPLPKKQTHTRDILTEIGKKRLRRTVLVSRTLFS